MKLQQLISAGFAITALAAASVPAVGWTLLGAVEQPAVSVQPSWDAAPLHLASFSPAPVAVEVPVPAPSDRDAEAIPY
jgi:hypothetical protein